MFEPESDIRVLLEGALLRSLDIGGLEGNRFVSVGIGEAHAAIPVAVPHVGAPEDNEAVFQLLKIGLECHARTPFCVESV
jgi:hypothetical protein